jgi:FkbM family methyltransferase
MEQYNLNSSFSFISTNNDFKYYSQDYGGGVKPIDKLILDKYITYWKKDSRRNENVNGVFLELGGYDGVTYSNTKTLEDHLNFTGILIEPSPMSFEKMRLNRPSCKNYGCAISNTDEKMVSFIGDDSAVGGLTHILENTNQSSGRNWIDAWSNVGQLNPEKITVPSKKLSEILKNENIKYIDLFSLDVEGAELEVLETMDWDIPVYLIVIEISAWGKAGKEMVEKCRQLLTKNNFTLDLKNGLDEVWINNNYFRKDILRLNI